MNPLILSSEFKLAELQLRCLDVSTGSLMQLQYAVCEELRRRGYDIL